jgi:hypothetical protein
MRGETSAPRGWYRCSDLINASQRAGVRFTRWQVLRAVAGLPVPEKKYGRRRYGRQHMAAVIEAATRMAETLSEGDAA